MTITVSEEHHRLIQAAVATGRFRSVEEAVAEALDLLVAQHDPFADASKPHGLVRFFGTLR